MELFNLDVNTDFCLCDNTGECLENIKSDMGNGCVTEVGQ